MNENREFDLLEDLARLLRKHGPDTFEKLAATLSTPGFAERLAAILSSTAKTGRSARPVGSTPKGEPRRDFRFSLVKRASEDPEKFDLLIGFYDALSAKTVLPTLREIQAFSQDAGLPLPKAAARDKAIGPLIRSLLPLKTGDIKALLERVKSAASPHDRTLEGWSSIILNKERREQRQPQQAPSQDRPQG